MAVDGKPLSKAFWRAWTAVGVSSLGDGLAFAALPLLAESLSKSGVWVTMTFAASRLPWLLFGLVAGAWVDSRPPRITMIQMDGVRFLAMFVLAIAVLAGVASIPLVLLIAFVIGMADCAHIPAAAAFLPSVVKTNELDRANSYLSSAELAGEQFAGPTFGAALFAWAPWIPFVGDAGSFFGSGLLIRSVPTVAPTRMYAKVDSFRVDIAAGWAYFRTNRDLWVLTLLVSVAAAVTGMTNSALVLYGKRYLGLSNWQFGVFISVPALGALVGSTVAFRIWRRIGTRLLMTGAFISLAISFFVVSQTKSPYVAAAALSIDGFLPPLVNTCIRTLRQQGVPHDLLGRVASVGRLMAIGAAFAGAAVAGILAELSSIPSVYGIAAAILVAALVLAGPRLRTLKLELARSS
jgi:MFS family permease